MKILSAAIKSREGEVFVGRSHAAIFQSQPKGVFVSGACQGFVTDDGIFVDRKEAARIAFEAGQTPKRENILFSEDLTGDWPWEKDSH